MGRRCYINTKRAKSLGLCQKNDSFSLIKNLKIGGVNSLQLDKYYSKF